MNLWFTLAMRKKALRLKFHDEVAAEKVEDVKEESWKDIEYNDQKKKDKKDKTRNNELQNTTQKAKDCTTRTHKNLW